MGRANCTPNFLEVCPDENEVDNQIHIEDEFVREHLSITPDPKMREIWYPFWKFRSEYQDSICPVEENTKVVFNLRQSIVEKCQALGFRNIRHQRTELILMEAAACFKVYCAYLRRLRCLLSRVVYVYNSIKMRKLEMLEEFAMDVDYDPIVIERYSHNIFYALRMALVLIEAMTDSIKTGKRVLICSKDNMFEMSKIYYKTKIDLPTDPFCRQIVHHHCKKFDKDGLEEENKQKGTGSSRKKSEDRLEISTADYWRAIGNFQLSGD